MSDMSYKHDEKTNSIGSDKLYSNHHIQISGAELDCDVKSQIDGIVKTEPLQIENCESQDSLDHQFQDMSDNIKLEDIKSLVVKKEASEIDLKSETEDMQLEIMEVIIKDEMAVENNMFDSEGFELVPHEKSTKEKMFTCHYQSDNEARLQNHLLVNKGPKDQAQVETLGCNECSFRSKFWVDLEQHMKVHTDPLLLEIFKCEECCFESKSRKRFKEYMLIFKDASEIKMFKCNECTFLSKYRRCVNRVMPAHKQCELVPQKKSTKETKFARKSCHYPNNHGGDFQQHLLLHENQPLMFKCNECSFETKYRSNIKRHIILHQDPSQVEIFRCYKCSFSSKYQSSLNQHMKRHVEMFRCSHCSYQSKQKRNLKRHMLVHRDPTKIDMLKCNECDYQGTQKSHLKQHMLQHRDRQQIEMFKCKECHYQSIHKGSLKQHMLVHTDPSEIPIFECNHCCYRSKFKSNIKKHMGLRHPSQIKT